MAKGRKWFKVLCECANCKVQRVYAFAFGLAANTADIVCKTCGTKGHQKLVGPAPKRAKEAVAV